VKLLVDNLASDTTEDDLQMLFECFGRVASVTMRKQGSAHIEMASSSAAKEAITSLHGQNLKGFDLSVAEFTQRSSQHNKRPRKRRRR